MKAIRGLYRAGRKEQRTPARHEDAYRLDGKLPDPMCCPRCGASYRRGRWTWTPAEASVPRHTCPACKRIEDDFPGGYVTLKGAFFAAHREEVMRMVTAREARARLEHPMQRIIGARDVEQGVLVTTTDAHLARGIAIALQEAFKGDLDFDFGHDENMLRATWSR